MVFKLFKKRSSQRNNNNDKRSSVEIQTGGSSDYDRYETMLCSPATTAKCDSDRYTLGLIVDTVISDTTDDDTSEDSEDVVLNQNNVKKKKESKKKKNKKTGQQQQTVLPSSLPNKNLIELSEEEWNDRTSSSLRCYSDTTDTAVGGEIREDRDQDQDKNDNNAPTNMATEEQRDTIRSDDQTEKKDNNVDDTSSLLFGSSAMMFLNETQEEEDDHRGEWDNSIVVDEAKYKSDTDNNTDENSSTRSQPIRYLPSNSTEPTTQSSSWLSSLWSCSS